ncbi:MAG: hypothetical protein U0841_14895 [Chloroflexia bacterium]
MRMVRCASDAACASVNFGGGKEHRVPGQGELHLDLFLLALAESGYDEVIAVRACAGCAGCGG